MTDTTYCVSLFERTLALAERAPRSVKQFQMAEAVGKSPAWVSDLLKRKMIAPSVHDVQKLHDFLVSVIR